MSLIITEQGGGGGGYITYSLLHIITLTYN